MQYYVYISKACLLTLSILSTLNLMLARRRKHRRLEKIRKHTSILSQMTFISSPYKWRWVTSCLVKNNYWPKLLPEQVSDNEIIIF